MYLCHGCIKAYRKKDCLRLDSITISCTQEAKCTSLKRSETRLKTKHFLSNSVASTVGTLRSHDATATRTPKTTIGLVGKTTTARASHFLVHFFAVLRDYAVKLPNFTFYGGRKQATRKFILFLNLNMILRNSTPGGFVYI